MSGSQTVADDEVLVLLIVGVLGGGAALGWLATAGDQARLRAVGWLVAHQALLPAGKHPLLQVPGGAGAGVDLPRLAIVGAVLLVVLAVLVGVVRDRVWRRRVEDPLL